MWSMRRQKGVLTVRKDGFGPCGAQCRIAILGVLLKAIARLTGIIGAIDAKWVLLLCVLEISMDCIGL